MHNYLTYLTSFESVPAFWTYIWTHRVHFYSSQVLAGAIHFGTLRIKSKEYCLKAIQIMNKRSLWWSYFFNFLRSFFCKKFFYCIFSFKFWTSEIINLFNILMLIFNVKSVIVGWKSIQNFLKWAEEHWKFEKYLLFQILFKIQGKIIICTIFTTNSKKINKRTVFLREKLSSYEK